eukprot:Pompholyxophrys_sp_v1_NODE_22_length_3962_cov_1.921423.p5 type:complete len:126 gc:universal NODE_22_length_3962_cov_1.921423:2920-3297(+)
MEYTKHLSEPWFTYVCLGIKTVEGRPDEDSWANMKVGDKITFYNKDNGIHRQCTVIITKISKHNTFETMLKSHGLKRTLPGYRSIKNGEDVYKKYYPKYFQKKDNGEPVTTNKVLGISIERLPSN